MRNGNIFKALTISGVVASVGAAPAFAGSDDDTKPKCQDVVCHWDNGDPLTLAGITLYGTVDAGYDYVPHGAGISPTNNTSQTYIISKNSGGPVSGWVGSPLETSKLGLKGTEKLWADTSFVFKVETGFNPVSGRLVDGIGALAADNGLSPAPTTASDSSRAGQIDEGAAWAGLSDKKLGTLTFGRQNAIFLDTMYGGDPMGGAGAFGLIGFSGTYGGGAGDTEDSRLDNSFRYANVINGIRVGAQYQTATATDGGQGFQFGLGADPVKGLSIDAAYANKTGGISAASLKSSEMGSLGPLGLASDKTVDATLSDNQAFALTAKYDGGPLKLFGGYEYITQGNSSNPESIVTATAGNISQTIGGYNLLTVSNTTYDSNRISQLVWAGVKYNFTNQLSGTTAYYHLWQNDYLTGAKSLDCAANTKANKGVTQSNCSGLEDVVSALLDYQIDKHWDTYVGAEYSAANGGLASGFLNDTDTSVTGGLRLKF